MSTVVISVKFNIIACLKYVPCPTYPLSVKDEVTVWSAFSTGTGKVQLPIVARWTVKNGLEPEGEGRRPGTEGVGRRPGTGTPGVDFGLLSAPLTNFYGRKLVLTAIHVSYIMRHLMRDSVSCEVRQCGM